MCLSERSGKMKKFLLSWNVVFYGNLYSAALLYAGYKYGESSQFIYPRGPEYFILPVVYLSLLGISIYIVREREYCKKKSYYAMGAFTLVISCLQWGRRLFFYSQGRMTQATSLDIYVFPATLFFFSVLICVSYFVCAVKTQKEAKFT